MATTVSKADALYSKRKNVRVKSPMDRKQWRPLTLAFGLMVGWLSLYFYTYFFFREPHAPVLYPFWLLMTSPHQWIVVVGLTLTVIGFHIQALQRVRWRWVLGSGLFHACLIAFAFFICGPMYSTTHLQTLATGPHTYQLAHARLTYGSWEWGYQMYIVLECDPTGMICRYDGTPYIRYNSCFAQDGVLIIDPATEKLLLRVANDTFHSFYEVGQPEWWVEASCPVRGLQR